MNEGEANIKVNGKKNNKETAPKGKTWLVTLNNPTCTLEEVHARTGARFTKGQLERGESGTLHLQFYQNYKEHVRMSHYKKHLPTAHAELVKVDRGVEKYCMKEETRVEGPWEYGDKPMDRGSRTDWKSVWENAKKGNIEDIPDDVKVRCYSNLKRIEKDHMEFEDTDDVRGHWIWGPSGVGKSTHAREHFPRAYPKKCNKWWDGYQGQRNVIMDDVGLDHKFLGYELKIWADKFGHSCEIKGGSVPSRHHNLVITSQYTIEQIWAEDPETVIALKRRFKVTQVPFKLYTKPMVTDLSLKEAEDVEAMTLG